MKKNTVIVKIMSVVLIFLLAITGLLVFNLVNKQTTVIASTSLVDTKGDKTEKVTIPEETPNIDNTNFEDLICQSAMIVGINKAIEESKTTEIEDSEEDVVEEEKQENKNNGYPYYIKINYAANTVTVYGLDSEGNYTVPVRAMICSTGKATPTSGVYRTQNKYQWKLLNGGVYGQYSTRITGSILFHSVPYSTNSKNSLISRYYDQLGKKASAGCIRLTVIDAKWIYDNCPLGTQVEIYSSSNPGPLGKPSAKKISSYPDNIKCWDPTDPDPNNPWHTYKEETNKTEENKTTTENTNTNNNQTETPSTTQKPTEEDSNKTDNNDTVDNNTSDKTDKDETTDNNTSDKTEKDENTDSDNKTDDKDNNDTEDANKDDSNTENEDDTSSEIKT